MVFPGPVCEVEESHKDKEKHSRIEDKTEKRLGSPGGQKEENEGTVYLEAIITHWTTFAEAQLPNQAM